MHLCGNYSLSSPLPQRDEISKRDEANYSRLKSLGRQGRASVCLRRQRPSHSFFHGRLAEDNFANRRRRRGGRGRGKEVRIAKVFRAALEMSPLLLRRQRPPIVKRRGEGKDGILREKERDRRKPTPFSCIGRSLFHSYLCTSGRPRGWARCS